MKILITGGAGFIGSHLADGLLAEGHTVRVFDALESQVHGTERKLPGYLNPKVEVVIGDIRDRTAVKKALEGVDAIFHEAAVVGVGQSMYEIQRYIDVNVSGTANLLETLTREKNKVRKLLVASSMSIYGEGSYHCPSCGAIHPAERDEAQLAQRRWEMRCPKCGQEAKPAPTSEEKRLNPTSVYAISKRDQEEMCLTVGRAYGIPATALRYFNVYGPRQALGNPYTGVLAIFCSRLLSRKPPVIYEDGLQTRDYVHVRDVVRANLLAMNNDRANYEVFNVGTGRPTAILDVARHLINQFGATIEPEVTCKYRAGDVRHCFASIDKIRALLGFTPSVTLEEGARELVTSIRAEVPHDRFDVAARELAARNLLR